VRVLQVVVYSALGVPAAAIFLTGIGWVVARSAGRFELSVWLGRVLIGSLYLGVAGAGLALVAGVWLAARKEPP
jgi:hypothetical protein